MKQYNMIEQFKLIIGAVIPLTAGLLNIITQLSSILACISLLIGIGVGLTALIINLKRIKQYGDRKSKNL